MGRSPNERLAREALDRRKRFPVAVVIVVHDDISLMRAVLEEVAAVVEHIVSNKLVCDVRGKFVRLLRSLGGGTSSTDTNCLASRTNSHDCTQLLSR